MIKVEYIDHMGDDLAVVNAARVSFNKESKWEEKPCPCGSYHPDYCDGSCTSPELFLSFDDTKLINYLAKHKHKSPFNHTFIKFRVKAPIFVARQLVKHEYLPWNEVSGRYVELEEFYQPEAWRYQAKDKKQGSGEDILDYEINEELWRLYSEAILAAERFYDYAVTHNVAKEQARIGLPLSTMTEWIWSGTLFAFAKMYALRTSPDAQYESRIVAEAIGKEIEHLFPVSWNALKGNVL